MNPRFSSRASSTFSVAADEEGPYRKMRQTHPTSIWLDLWTIVLLVIPIYSCFFPLESYLSLGSGEGLTGFRALPIPVTTISLVIIAISVCYYAAIMVRRGSIRHEALAYAFIAVAFLSVAWSTGPNIAFMRALRLIPYVFLGLLLPQVYTLQRLLRLMTIAYLISALISIFMSVAIPSLGGSRLGGGYENAWRGAIVHKNLTGIVFAVAIPVTWAALSQRAVSWKLAAATVLPCLLMLVRSGSGTAMSGLLICCSLGAGMIIVQRSPIRLRILLLVALLLLGIGAVFAGLLVVDAVFSAAGRDLTFTGRTPIWAAVWQLITAHPVLGYGYAFWSIQDPTARWVSQSVGTYIPHSHNSWLDLWLQLGVGGMITIALMSLIGLKLSLKLILFTNHRLGPPLFAILFLILFRSMTEVQYSDPFVSLLFFPIWGLMSARIAVAESQTSRVKLLTSRRGMRRSDRLGVHHA